MYHILVLQSPFVAGWDSHMSHCAFGAIDGWC